MKNVILALSIAVLLQACASGPRVTTILPLSGSTDAPYENVLVISLFKSFDARRYLEQAIVEDLSSRGIKAVASTSLMNTRTPVNRETFISMAESLDSDAVLVTQFVSLASEGKMKNMNPQATYNLRSTYYYNVFSVELTEYSEPKSLELKHSLVLATQVYSASTREPVWAIESSAKIVQDFDQQQGYTAIGKEAKAIGQRLARDGLIRN